MKRQAYVRVVEVISHLEVPIEIIVGVELHALLSVSAQYEDVRQTLKRGLSPSILHNYSDASIAEVIEGQIKDRHPGRSYFIEVGRGNLDEYVQVFQP